MGDDRTPESIREGKDAQDVHDRGGVHGDSHAEAEESPAGGEPTVGAGGSGPDPDDPQQTISDDGPTRQGEDISQP